MFELIDRQSWLDYHALPAIVRDALAAQHPTKAYPTGLTERLDFVERKAVAGQQPGFGGGPLYSTYKRWTAAQITQNDPIHNTYWIEAGDSDWNEIAHIDTDREVLRWEDLAPGVPVGDRELPPDFRARITNHWSSFSRVQDLDGAFTGTVRDSFFSFHWLCDPSAKQTVFFDGPPFLLKSNVSKVKAELAEWLERLGEGVTALELGIERVTHDYHTPQATLQSNKTGWFWVPDPNSPRLAVEHASHRLFRIGDKEMNAHDLSAMAKEGVGIFIPGALWRTLLQQALLHPTTVVVGAAEAAYWGEVAELFKWAGMRFPKLLLRVGATVLPANTSILSRADIFSDTAPEIAVPDEWRVYQDAIAHLDSSLAALPATAPEHLRDAIAKGREKAIYQLNRIVELGAKYRDEQTGSRRKRWEQARELAVGTHAKPPQERRMTLLEAYLRWSGEGLMELREKIFQSQEGGRFLFRES